MELVLRNPEKALERREIMQKVWETDYVDDTRTLDVHIRWLRKVIEPDPRQPHYLTTVRGMGYCLTLPPANGKTPETPPAPEE
jgi:DNA-binding response OmpR family regulator